jgi:hypothetical protein
MIIDGPGIRSTDKADQRSWTLLLVDGTHLPSAVIPAVAADGVRELQLMALRALARADRLERVVRPALGRARLGVASLGIRHDW